MMRDPGKPKYKQKFALEWIWPTLKRSEWPVHIPTAGQLGNIFLGGPLRRFIIHVFVSSRVDCCNSLLYGLPAYHLNKLHRVQNAAARLIF